jgi:SapC protein
MTRLVPVREIAHRRLALPADDRWVDDLTWIPVSATEIHLASRYYPLAIRFDARKPLLGLIVDQRYIMHPLLDPAGRWRGAYRPIGLRCFPFAAPTIGDDPLSDIVIEADSPYLSETAGTSILDDTGRPGRLLNELHRLFHLLKRGEESFAGMLDQYLIGGLLVPLADPDRPDANGDRPLYVLDPTRFLHMEHAAFGAMARHSFLSVDIAVACVFSLQNLRPDYRPKDAGRTRHPRLSSMPLAPDMIAIDDLPLALDDGELISLWNIDTWQPKPGLERTDRPQG